MPPANRPAKARLARRRRCRWERVGFGSEAVFTREGGSIGAVPMMERVLGAPVVFLGLSLPEHGYHAQRML
jgi:hypothetical protein